MARGRWQNKSQQGYVINLMMLQALLCLHQIQNCMDYTIDMCRILFLEWDLPIKTWWLALASESKMNTDTLSSRGDLSRMAQKCSMSLSFNKAGHVGVFGSHKRGTILSTLYILLCLHSNCLTITYFAFQWQILQTKSWVIELYVWYVHVKCLVNLFSHNANLIMMFK